jgi:SHS2 domain-containing protein
MADSRGHRLAPHTADIRIEAWAPTREECLAEAVKALVDSFADASACPEPTIRTCLVEGEADEAVLVALLDEVIYRMETSGELTTDVELSPLPADTGVEARFAMVDVACVESIGAVPKAVSWHEVAFARDANGWSCSVTVDV